MATSLFNKATIGLAAATKPHIPKGSIGTVQVPVTLRESYSDNLRVTDHPVDAGADISDHSYIEPKRVVLTCGWSNTMDQTSIVSDVVSLILPAIVYGVGGLLAAAKSELSSTDYVAKMYKSLLDAQIARIPLVIVTTMRKYKNMLIETLDVERDEKSVNILVVIATCREVIITTTAASTSATSAAAAAAPIANQAEPTSTAATITGGAKNLLAGTPSLGGVVPIANIVPTGNLLSSNLF